MVCALRASALGLNPFVHPLEDATTTHITMGIQPNDFGEDVHEPDLIGASPNGPLTSGRASGVLGR